MLYHDPGRRPLQDVLTCIREKTTIEAVGRKLEANAERFLKTPREMARLFRDFPEAVAETMRFADRIDFSLDQLKYQYPDEPVPPGKTAQGHLEDLTWAGVQTYFGGNIDDKLRATLKKELALIAELKYAHYFLTVHDIVHYARSQNILCQGRGSAANSAVCYVLGITSVDPTSVDLLFERFISKERLEPPDIDVDFEHSRREEVMQYVYRRYGRHRAAIIATIIHYRPRSAIRDVGKALGLTEDVTAALADTVWGSWGKGLNDMQVRQAGLDPQNPMINLAVELATELIEFPRHLSQHVGGYVLTQDRLDTYVPIGNAAMDDRTFIEWDKDDVDALNMMKVDVLALGMLTCIRKCFDLIDQHKGKRWVLASVPQDDPKVYDMLCDGESLGVFQVESRAQMNMLPRLKPRTFYDLVIEVAIVRPGPIQGDMVHPYLRRRNGLEKVSYPSPSPDHGDKDELYNVLHKTLGVPLFQEQAMRIAIEAAKFTSEEANGLRRSMATFRNVGTIGQYEEKLIGNMVARGYDANFARSCFDQIKGFGSYGFPGEPCRELRPARLHLLMAEISSPRRLLLRPLELAADGLLRAGADRRRRPQERRRGARDRRVLQLCAEHAGEHGRQTIALFAWVFVRSTAFTGSIRMRSSSKEQQAKRQGKVYVTQEDWADRIIEARDRQSLHLARRLRPRHRSAQARADPAGGCRCIPLARARPPRGAVAGAAAARRCGAAAVRSGHRARAAGRAGQAAARDAASRTGRRRLPDHPAVTQGTSDGILARDVFARADRRLQGDQP